MYLVSKLQQDRYGCCILKIKCQNMLEKIYLETSKNLIRYRSYFLMSKRLQKGNNRIFRPF